MRRLIILTALLATTVSAQPERAPFTVVETGQSFATLQEAVSSVRLGTATIRIAPGTYRQCAVQQGGRITYQAEQRGTAIFEQQACEEKAALVLRGQESVVDGLVFRGYSVPDGNGAGIRTEMGDLTVRNTMFLDSQEGILGGQPTGQRIVIHHSTFSGLGRCGGDSGCAHSVYLDNRGTVTITHSRFERGRGGHYVKIRSPHVTITDNSFDDTRGTATNYMIDLPNGATGLIEGNLFVQGSHKENHSAFIAVAAENRNNNSAGLKVDHNDARLGAGAPTGPAFVANYSDERLAIGANQLGPGIKRFEGLCCIILWADKLHFT